MKKYRIAAILMLFHGGCMEIGGAFSLVPALFMDPDVFDFGKYFSFRLPYFQENLVMITVLGVLYGALRILGAIGLLRNRKWGLALSVINCTLSLALMMFLLPAGLLDGLLAGTALVLILTQFYGNRPAC